ncbi:MAG: DNA repair protein RecN [Chloroflexota bacterium]|nr:DNA repair protein RecN [Chloroflexota bacterium]
MLRELHIRNFAIIDELHLQLEEGFNILTGETGAGKSILIDAVDLILGSRADLSAVRAGESRALIEGLFTLTAAEQAARAALLTQEELRGERADTLWLSRELRADGRSVARVNGTVVSLALLGKIAEGLIDIHGQSEHLSLLQVREHLNFLDRFAGVMELRSTVAQAVQRWQRLRRELQKLRTGERERIQRLDTLHYQAEEISAASLQPEEIATLEEEHVRLANAEQLAALCSQVLRLLEDGLAETGTPAALDMLGRSQRELNTLVRIDATLSTKAELLNDVVYRVEDLARDLRAYLGEIEFSPRRLRQVEDRLVLLRQLLRKYGGTLAEVLVYAEQARQTILELEGSDERIAELCVAEGQLRAEVTELATELSARRRSAAQELAVGVEHELADLRMSEAHFGIIFRLTVAAEGLQLPSPQPAECCITARGSRESAAPAVQQAAFDVTGMEQVEFLIESNVGEGLKPMVRIASGGETARLMLALKTVLSRADHTSSLIFDEIDQGIGGRVGAVVGAKLWRLTVSPLAGLAHQVLCITHLPQLAGFGDVHFGVRKEVAAGRTRTRVERLEHEARLQELVQMLGTAEDSAWRGAREILNQATRFKREEIAQREFADR